MASHYESESSTQQQLLQPAPILPIMSDKQLSLFLPFVIYWAYSIFWHLVSKYEVRWFEPYRIHTPAEILERNRVSVGEVIRGVLVQQFLQTVFGLVVIMTEEDELVDHAAELAQYRTQLDAFGERFGIEGIVENAGPMLAQLAYWLLFPMLRFAAAMIFLDTWQYFMHRAFHQVPFLYRHIHSIHHRLYAPYAFGALYNHPVEAFVMDCVGAGLAFKISGMGTHGGMLFFSFCTLKTVDDHCGYDLPYNPLQRIFNNNAYYHDIHHQTFGIKANFSQPFFTIWDRILNTHMPQPPAGKFLSKKTANKAFKTTNIQSLSLKANGVIRDDPVMRRAVANGNGVATTSTN